MATNGMYSLSELKRIAIRKRYLKDETPCCKSILNVALDVHMYKDGSYECSEKQHKYNLKTLRFALKNWHVYKNDLFQQKVKELIEAALEQKGFWEKGKV